MHAMPAGGQTLGFDAQQHALGRIRHRDGAKHSAVRALQLGRQMLRFVRQGQRRQRTEKAGKERKAQTRDHVALLEISGPAADLVMHRRQGNPQ